MSKGKPRWYPDKLQNNKKIPCPLYEKSIDGTCYCEHGSSVTDTKVCKGNPHNCIKTQYHKAASRSNQQIINDYKDKK